MSDKPTRHSFAMPPLDDQKIGREMRALDLRGTVQRRSFHCGDQQAIADELMKQDSTRSLKSGLPGRRAGEGDDNFDARCHVKKGRRSSLDSIASCGSYRSMSKSCRYVKVNSNNKESTKQPTKIFDDPAVVAGYDSVPILDVDRLPRGGISFETKAVGRIQFGIPPETIKDSMSLGLGVPSVYIVPAERFCREIGPALGINLCEFEFPAYFNYFVRVKRCALVIDSNEDEQNIRRVFGETLFGPAQFRNHSKPKPNEDEDFDSTYPVAARPNFYKEFYHFRTAEESNNYEEMTIDTLIQFVHFQLPSPSSGKSKLLQSSQKLGVPPPPPAEFFINASYHNGNEFESTVNSSDKGYESYDSTRETKKSESAKFSLSRSPRCTGETCPGCKFCKLKPETKSKEVKPERKLRRVVSDPDLSSSMNLSSTTGRDDSSFSNLNQKHHKRPSDTLHGRHDESDSKMGEGFWGSAGSINDSEDGDKRSSSWTYSQAKWLGSVATLYPPTASDVDKERMMTERVEIFKMPGGLEYIVHDINSHNVIVGKVRFSGTVHIPDSIAVHGFTPADETHDVSSEPSDYPRRSSGNSSDEDHGHDIPVPRAIVPPSFHPPSFGVTVLGNSHGFDKSGSTSGYVLWINGRGVMIDPPPYSSATLDIEGIRPQMIMAIIVTHCHADHDAGAFQKVMTGSRVAVITTPTIYNSFIRKYAALSGLSPALLRHSHRHRPAIIGQPLLFQGATFHFTYTLHTIPCIAFKVECRGRSIVFTGDHLNSPPMIDRLEGEGVLAKERADSLRQLPFLDCDILLHESGAPPIHTPLKVLLDLPEYIKKRLYVVHTSALPEGCELRVAPPGTAATLRLDEEVPPSLSENKDDAANCTNNHNNSGTIVPPDGSTRSGGSSKAECSAPVSQIRPTSVSDAWFILNLLSNVPFLSSLSYDKTMEVLETAQVKVVNADEVIIPANRRPNVLCVVWEGTCMEKPRCDLSGDFDNEYGGPNHFPSDDASLNSPENNDYLSDDESSMNPFTETPAVWHAGDWTGPLSLQPDPSLSGDFTDRMSISSCDVVAVSPQGVKVIIIYMKDLHAILKNGSLLYRKYLTLREQEAERRQSTADSITNHELFDPKMSSRASFYAPMRKFKEGDINFLEIISFNSCFRNLSASQKRHFESLVEGPRYFEAGQFLWHVGESVEFSYFVVSGTAKFAHLAKQTRMSRRGSTGSIQRFGGFGGSNPGGPNKLGNKPSQDKLLFRVPGNSEYARLEVGLQLRAEEVDTGIYEHPMDLLPKQERLRNSRDRFANKVLARLYSRRAYTAGLVFSRGHFLSDTTRMVSGSLASVSGGSNADEAELHAHSSNLIAGPDGCVVMVFPKESLISFLDANPGILLSLLGTQIVV